MGVSPVSSSNMYDSFFKTEYNTADTLYAADLTTDQEAQIKAAEKAEMKGLNEVLKDADQVGQVGTGSSSGGSGSSSSSSGSSTDSTSTAPAYADPTQSATPASAPTTDMPV